MADLTKNIIFRIGTELGPGGLASLKAGYDMVVQMGDAVIRLGKVIADQVNQTQEWMDIQKNVKVNLSEVDKNARALIGTLNLMKEANRLTAANINLSSGEFSALATYIAEFSDATGMEAPEALSKMVSALIAGTERGLKPFGIQLKDGQTRAQNISEAVDQVVDKAYDLAPALDTIADKQKQVNDLWERGRSVIGFAIENAANYNTTLGVLARTFDVLTTAADQWLTKVEAAIQKQKELQDKQRQLNEEQAKLDAAKAIAGGNLPPDMALMLAKKYGFVPPELGVKIEEPFQISATKPKGGGGAYKLPSWFRAPESKYVLDIEVVGVEALEYAAAALDAINENFRQMGETEIMKVRHEIQNARDELALWDNPDYRKAKYEQWTAEAELQKRIKIEQANLEAEYIGARKVSAAEEWLGIDQTYINESKKIWDSGVQGKLSQLNLLFSSGSGLMGAAMALQRHYDAEDDKAERKRTAKMKRMWEIGKAASIGSTITATAMAAMEAYAALSGIWIVGPALGAAAAAAIIATGATQVALIRAQSFEGGRAELPEITSQETTGGGHSPSFGGGSSYGAGSYNYPGTQQQEIKITINMGDNAMFLDAIVDANDQAGMSGRRYFARAS